MRLRLAAWSAGSGITAPDPATPVVRLATRAPSGGPGRVLMSADDPVQVTAVPPGPTER